MRSRRRSIGERPNLKKPPDREPDNCRWSELMRDWIERHWLRDRRFEKKLRQPARLSSAIALLSSRLIARSLPLLPAPLLSSSASSICSGKQ
jgi:hypothetical protein